MCARANASGPGMAHPPRVVSARACEGRCTPVNRKRPIPSERLRDVWTRLQCGCCLEVPSFMGGNAAVASAMIGVAVEGPGWWGRP